MGLDIRSESWIDFWPEFSVIWEQEQSIELHPKEVTNHQMNHEAYALWERMGLLDVVVAREDNKIVGYFVVVTMPYVNFTNYLCGMVMLYYVRPEHRKKGIGQELVLHMERKLRSYRSIDCIIVNTKTDHPFTDFFTRRGYHPHETLLMKWY